MIQGKPLRERKFSIEPHIFLPYHFSMTGEAIIQERYPMRNSNLFGTGGSARYYAQPNNMAELMSVLEEAYRRSLRITVIGGGTHILVPEEGIDGLVISTKAMRGLSIKGDLITAAPGEMLDSIINIAIDHNLVGMEELGGIPGTIAGAMTCNASANGKSLSDVFFYADYITPGGQMHRRPYYSDVFSKQDSAFNETEIITSVALRLFPSKATAEARMKKEAFVELFFIPPCARLSGQIFKDPEGYDAASLIRESGLAGPNGTRAEFSLYQSNCIFTYPNATSGEIRHLIDTAIITVKKKLGILLEPSITLL